MGSVSGKIGAITLVIFFAGKMPCIGLSPSIIPVTLADLRPNPSSSAVEPSGLGRPSLLRESGLLNSGLLAAWRLPYTPNEATAPPVTRIIGHHDAWSQVLLSLEDAEDAMITCLCF